MTAVAADPPNAQTLATGMDSLVSQPRQEVTYAARREDLRLVKEQRYPVLGPGGRQVSETRGVVIKFTYGQLRLPLEGKVTTEQGHQVDSAEIIAWLDSHHLNGNRDEGFFKVPQAAPGVTDEEIERITEAAMLHDTATLTAIRDAEMAGWRRQAILKVVEKRIAQAEQMKAEYEAQIEAQADEAPKAAKKAPGK